MQLPNVIEVKGIRVLTSKQIAEGYGTTIDVIKKNFSNNRDRFTEGKHYITFSGDELRAFKNEVKNVHLVGNRASHLYLWTEKGALLHAKSLNTDKAWEVYDYLVDFYFRAKEKAEKTVSEQKPITKPIMQTVVDVPDNPKILAAIRKVRNDLTAMDVLLEELIRYHSEESYKEKVRAATGIIHILVGDSSKLLGLKPQLVQKQY